MENLVEETADQGWRDVKFREEQRQAAVPSLPQPQPLLILLVDSIAAQHALEQLHRGERGKTLLLIPVVLVYGDRRRWLTDYPP